MANGQTTGPNKIKCKLSNDQKRDSLSSFNELSGKLSRVKPRTDLGPCSTLEAVTL